MEKLKIGVIGTGRLGSIHARVYSELPHCELVGVCDTNQTIANDVAHRFHTKAYANYKDLIGHIDAASIAVPTTSHFEIAQDLIRNNIHLLVEKPITNNLKQAQKLRTLARSHGVILQVGHVERFNQAFTAVQKIAHNPRFIECHRLSPFPQRSLDVGVVLDIMIHDIDIVLGLVKSPVKRVDAVGISVLTNYEDIANVRLTFKNGCVCNLTASRISEEALRKIRLFIPDAYISLDYSLQEAFVFKKESGRITKDALPIEKEEPLKAEIESFTDCVMNKKQPVVSADEAYRALSLANTILKQIWKKKRYL